MKTMSKKYRWRSVKLVWQKIPIRDLPEIRQVTNIGAICEALNKTCHQNASRRGSQTVKILFGITCGIGDFPEHIFGSAKTKNVS